MLPVNVVTGAVGLALDMAERRASVASHNVAVANVPGSSIERADFSGALSVLERVAGGEDVDPSRLAGMDTSAVHSAPIDQSLDGVSLDREVTELALANVHYQALAEALNRQFGLMNIALSGDQA